jgi:hypothetical protein
MPIDIERFERAPEEDLGSNGGPTNAERVLSFLAANDGQAFTPAELREATGVARGSIGVVLSRLEDRGLVRHRGEYWAVGEAEAVDRELTASRTARAAGERFGPEDPEEWGPGIDERESE